LPLWLSIRRPRYRGRYKDSDGRYKSAGTNKTEERPWSGVDPVVRATRTIEEYAPSAIR
jgi:hypothetical protein